MASHRQARFGQCRSRHLKTSLRNSLSHPAGRVAFTLGMADSMLRVSHLVVRDACATRAMTRDAE